MGDWSDLRVMVADDIEFEIKRLPAGFRARCTYFAKGDVPPDTRLCVSEREAMIWINSRLALRGFEEGYDMGEKRRRVMGG
jgi:hypothetical protein